MATIVYNFYALLHFRFPVSQIHLHLAMHYIQNRQALLKLCEKLAKRSWLTLDTEFMRESTYYAELCLIQISYDDTLACIDPLALDNIDPLLDILYEQNILKIFHAGRQDMELFYDIRKNIPAPVFDTQLAAAFLGYADQIGYAGLVEDMLNIKLDKSYTRTDWSKRPLSEGQILYALDDVRYLYPLYQLLHERLQQSGRLNWVMEDTIRLLDNNTYCNDPQRAYLRIKQTGKLSTEALSALKKLAAWREQVAQQRNRPRNWIIPNKTLIDISINQPDSLQQLATLQTMNKKIIERWGQSILDLVHNSKDFPDTNIEINASLNKSQTKICKTIQSFIGEESEKLQIQPGVLASKKDIKAYILNETDNTLTQGWRHELLGENLQSLLQKNGGD